MPHVSILTLSYNKGPYLAECIDSVLAQSYTDWEMILIDDGSVDETWEVAQKYAGIDARIKVYRKEHGGVENLAATHNYALTRAKGDLIAILDGDDSWPPDKLERQVAVHDDDVLMSYGKFLLYTESGMHVGPTPPFTGAIDSLVFLRHLLLHQSYMINVTLMMSRETLEQVGGFHQDGSRGADMPTGLRISQLSGRVYYLPTVLGHWRQHPVQHTRTHGAFIAEYNMMLSIKTLLELPPTKRQEIGVSVADIIEARCPMIADTYFHATRTALLRRDRAELPELTRQLWYYGGAKRKLQALYARLAAPLGLDFEPILRWFEVKKTTM